MRFIIGNQEEVVAFLLDEIDLCMKDDIILPWFQDKFNNIRMAIKELEFWLQFKNFEHVAFKVEIIENLFVKIELIKD